MGVGETMFEKMKEMESNYDHYRQFLLYEPRGSPIMMGNFIFPPSISPSSPSPAAVAGYVIMEQTEYPPMSGHNTMCVATGVCKLHGCT